LPIITTITTTILVFSSMFLMGGTMGKFIYVIPLVVIFALILSLLEVSIALPAHLAGSASPIKESSWFNSIEDWFSSIMKRIIQRRYWVLGVFVVVLVFSLSFAKNNMQTVLFPSAGSNIITATMEMQKGASLQHTKQASEQVERLILKTLGKNINSVSNKISRTYAKFHIDLIHSNLRTENAQVLVEKLRAKQNEVKGITRLSFSIKRSGPPQGADIQVRLMGDSVQRSLATDELNSIMKNIKGLNDISRDDEPGKKRLEVVLDFAKMAQLNIDFSVVNRYLRTAFTGVDITHIRQDEAQVDFRVYFGNSDNSEAFLKQLKISNAQGNLVPLHAFSTVKEIEGEPDFNHVNGRRATRISASINDKITDVKKVTAEILRQFNSEKKYPKVEMTVEGGAKDTKKSMQDFVKAFVFSIFGIYLLLLLLFNSYTQPLLVLSAIPFSVIGVIWAFFIHGEPLSFFSALGILALVGVIVNDSLILVSHLNFLKTQEDSKHLSIQQQIISGTTDRLRAVVLTTLTTLAGIIPLAYGIGGVDTLLQPMALALGYGLLFGTLMTLILLPCLYMVNHEFLQKITQLQQKIQQKIAKFHQT
jgi:multidrug efflux pump subunit AcrB